MTLKKMGAVLGVVALSLFLASCGNKQEASSSAGVTEESSVQEETSKEITSLYDGRITLVKPGFDEKVKELKKKNTDVVGWISLDGTDSAYPLLQAEDNEYYLRRNINKKYDVYGIPYLDMENTSMLTDQNTVVYGHMTYGNDVQQFGALRFYLDQKYTDKSPKTVTITTENGIYTYRLFSIRNVSEDAPYRDANMEEAVYAALIKKTVEGSKIDFDYHTPITTKDRILTLSTCTPNKIEDERLVIAGVLEKAEVTKEAFEAFKTVFSEGAESAPAEISAE